MPLTLLRGVQLADDERLHDVREVVAETGKPSVVTTDCGIKAESTGARLWHWTPEETAPPRCTDCRDLPPFWAD